MRTATCFVLLLCVSAAPLMAADVYVRAGRVLEMVNGQISQLEPVTQAG